MTWPLFLILVVRNRGSACELNVVEIHLPTCMCHKEQRRRLRYPLCIAENHVD